MHTTFADGAQLVEEYDIKSGQLLGQPLTKGPVDTCKALPNS